MWFYVNSTSIVDMGVIYRKIVYVVIIQYKANTEWMNEFYDTSV